MPACRECGARLTKFDNDICPVCGCKKPLEGVDNSTKDFTQEFSNHAEELKDAKVKSKVAMLILFILLGWTGAGWFYLLFKKKGFIWLGANVAEIVAVGVLITFVFSAGYIGFIASAAISYVINIIFGLILFLKANLKDGAGEFVR